MLVIFDCDGVLVDTEALANQRLSEWITAAGLPLTGPQCRKRFVGMSMYSVRDTLRADDGIDLGEDFPERWADGLPDLFSDGVNAIPHVAELIGRLDKSGVPLCVASSANVGKMHTTLGSVGLLERLEPVLFSADMVARGKPAPDLFLFAASSMGFEPSACIVIEDAVAGVKAGRAAGMRVLAYHGDPESDIHALTAAGGELFDDMRKVPALLGISG
ncbi:MAG: HAD family phosphatase [Rhizobiaceae bacterium]|nr:HAD family phosphatase [Rhizobiaceae bacterium]